jgi:hypothetical protein
MLKVLREFAEVVSVLVINTPLPEAGHNEPPHDQGTDEPLVFMFFLSMSGGFVMESLSPIDLH